MTHASMGALLRLNATGAPPSTLRKLIGDRPPEEALSGSAGDWAAKSGMGEEAARRLRERALSFDVAAEISRLDRLGARVLAGDDAEYPDILRAVSEAPLLLMVRGRLGPPTGAVALVGSRRPTPYGLRMAGLLAEQTCRAGGIVVSGLARGIDAEAHRAALACGGRTWAVLGSGLGRVYPPENEALAEQIVKSGGCLVSEFPVSEAPFQKNFPRRNRIVAGLSWATVVVEGENRSGSLITARLAAEQGREVFAVPGPADSPLSEAPHILMENGARPARGMKEVFESLPPGAKPYLQGGQDRSPAGSTAVMPPGLVLAEAHEKILELLGPYCLTLEELAEKAGWPVKNACRVLLEMEFKELIRPIAGQRYAKK